LSASDSGCLPALLQGGLGQWIRDDLPVEEGRKEVPAPVVASPGPRAKSKSGSSVSEKLMAGTRSLRR
jgi:3-mercaptopyruvate sulfurtransferase SseA